jgi:tetratricopeptide (TPR) repeat protein
LGLELHGLARTYPESGAIQTALAESELDLKHFDAAGAAADLALAIDPANSRALLWKGLSQTHALLAAKSHDGAVWKAARASIIKANRANPNDPLPLFENFQSYRDQGITPPESAVKGLEGAQILVPQNPILRIFFAVALADRQQTAEAVEILLPVANDPHGGGLSDFANKLVAAIWRAKASGSVAEVDEMERLFSHRGS